MDYHEKCVEAKGEYCHICGTHKNINVHHIDADRSNNDLSNLVPLCANCHADVHHGEKSWPPEKHRTYQITLTETAYATVLSADPENGASVEEVVNKLLSESEIQNNHRDGIAEAESSTTEKATLRRIMQGENWLKTREVYHRYTEQVEDPKSLKTIRRKLNQMCEERLARKRGEAKGRQYRLANL